MIEEHTPKGLGNHAAIVTEPVKNYAFAENIKNMLEAMHYTGFSNFDIKYTGEGNDFRVFEINLRQGRSNFYVTSCGMNIARLAVEKWNDGGDDCVLNENAHFWRFVPSAVAFEYTKDKELVERAKSAKFDERIALIGLLLDGVYERTRNVFISELCLKRLTQEIKLLRNSFSKQKFDLSAIDNTAEKLSLQLEKGKQASSLSKNDKYTLSAVIKTLFEIKETIMRNGTTNGDTAFGLIRDFFNEKHADLKEASQNTINELSNAFKFMEKCFGDGQEMLVFVTELTINDYTTSFISHYGCNEYFKHNKELLLYDRHKEIIREIEIFDIDDGEE
jgi:hypothetical protein